MNKEIEKNKKICESYMKLQKNVPYGYGHHPGEIIDTCELLDAMGWEWGHDVKFKDFHIRKGYYISNNGSGHQSNKNTWYIEWDNGNIGKYQFVGDKGYRYIDEEWAWFKNKLMSYNPINYDPYNCHIVYDVENGKRVLEDYKDICMQVREKIKKRMALVELEEAKRKIEELQKELNDE